MRDLFQQPGKGSIVARAIEPTVVRRRALARFSLSLRVTDCAPHIHRPSYGLVAQRRLRYQTYDRQLVGLTLSGAYYLDE